MRRHPGVTYLGEKSGKRWYRIRSELIHPKTGRVHEIDRKIVAQDAADAARVLASVRAKWLSERAGAPPSGARRRLGEAMDNWLSEKKLTVKPSTGSTYGSAVAWWRELLGDYWIDAVEPRDVRGVLLGAREGGDATDTIDGRLRVLRTFARDSRCASIVEGVSVRRDVREDERIEDEGRGLSLEELRRFLAAGPGAAQETPASQEGPRHRGAAARGETAALPFAWWRRAWTLVATMAWTGLRFGEASALEWRDVDLDACTIRVRRAQWRGTVGHVKAKCSKRTIVIPEELASLLRAHRTELATIGGLVFPSRRAGAVYVSNTHARKAILRVCAAAGIALAGRPTIHCLRHTANNLVRQCTSEIVRRALLGHADDESGERYSAVTSDEKRRAVAGVVRMIRGGE
jgi:integrase